MKINQNNYIKSLLSIFIPVLLICLIYPISSMATVPRVSSDLFSSNTNQIFAVDLPGLISTDIAEQGLVTELVKVAMLSEQVGSDITILPLLRIARYYIEQESALVIVGRHLNLATKEN